MAKQGGTVIDVIDNGPGIPNELLDKKFVPFFTTKREGSGVRLALSRQIMIAHSGNILLNQVESGGTQFSLLF
ncbi:MAG: ATP-binding protein [Pseudomonadales bacterium]